MDNGNYNIEPIIRRIQETAFTEGYEAGKKEAVKRGHWIEIAGYGGWSETYYQCPECNATEYIPSNYCPNCGTELRGIDNG